MMNPQHERLNEQLEQSLHQTTPDARGTNEPPDEHNSEVDALVDLARRLQTAPQLRVDADFADKLERRMLRHALEYRRETVQLWILPRLWRRLPVVVALLVLLLVLLGAGVLAMAARTASPTNPFYAIKQWEQGTLATPTASSVDKPALDLQLARARLNDLITLANPTHTDQYLQALSRFDKQLTTATSSINALPAGAEKTRLAGQLDNLRNDARKELQEFLHTLASSASLATTAELGQLGEQIPQLSGATIVLPAHPKGTATIRLSGSGIQSGARLLVNGELMQVTGTVQQGKIVFVLTWNSEQHPHTLGIMNPDGTAAQTSNVTVQTAAKSGNGNGNNNGNGNDGENGKKPEKTPTSHH